MTLSPQDFGTAAARRNLAGHYRELLLQDCLPFWFPRCIDHEFGGFLHCFDRDGTLVDTDKSVWAQGRMSWMLLTLSQETELGSEQQRADWMNWGESGLRFLQQHCVSRQEPGPGEVQVPNQLYFQVTRDGRPLRKRRYVYSESFAAIAAAA
ncbi:MAG: AGE family epimerase/isomerase, partial [Planctomycetaceae bacterium]